MSDAHTPSRPRRDVPGLFPGAWTVATVRGVPLRLHRSVLVIAALIAWSMLTYFEPRVGDEVGRVGVLLLTAAGAVLFVLSILAHELAHMLTSLDRGIGVRSVTLFLLGGVTESIREASRARDELVIVGSGPLTSLVLGALFGLGATATEGSAVAFLLGYLGWINIALGVFNLVPGYPLDGGRLLRAMLWAATGRRHLATRWSARVGQAFAVVLMAYGLWQFSASGGGFTGVWYVLIGFFLLRGASDAHRRARSQERAAAVTARALMGTVPPTLPADMPLREAVERVAERPSLLWPVGDPLVGGLTLARIDDVPASEWDVVVTGRVAAAAADVTIDADAPAAEVLERLAQAPDQMLIVTEHGRPVGLVTASLVSHLAT